MGWASTEFETIDLGDERRNKRAIRLVERLSAQPTASVPQACGDWADTIAAYRFFNNEAVDWRAILGAHTDWGSKPEPQKIPSSQLQPSHERVQVDRLSVTLERVVPV